MGASLTKSPYSKQKIQDTKPLSDNNQNEIKQDLNLLRKNSKSSTKETEKVGKSVPEMLKESPSSKTDQKLKTQNGNLLRGILKRMSKRNKKSKHKRAVSPVKKDEKISNNRPSSLATFKTENTESLSIQDYNSQVISINTDNASILTLNSGLIKGIQIDQNKSNEKLSELNVVQEMDKKFDKIIINETKSPELNGDYFLNLLNHKIQSLSSSIKISQTYTSLPNLPDEATGTINSAIGSSTLLLKSKFVQFQNLCDSNLKANWGGGDNSSKIDENGDPRPTNQDLQGFWEMMLIQIENVENKFKTVEKMKNNNWVLPEQDEIKLNLKSNSIPVLNSSRPVSAQNSTCRSKVKSKVGSASCNSTPTRGRKNKGKQSNSSSALREQIKAARKAKLEADKNVESKSSSVLERGLDNFVILDG